MRPIGLASLVLVARIALLPSCASGWKPLPVASPPSTAPTVASSLVPDKPYVLPELPPAEPRSPAAWPEGGELVLDTSPVPILPVRDARVRAAKLVTIRSSAAGIGGSSERRVTFTRESEGDYAFVAEGSRTDRARSGAATVSRRGRIARERVDRLLVRLAALGRSRAAGPIASAAKCAPRACSYSSLSVTAGANESSSVTYTRSSGACASWTRDGATLDLDVPGVAEAAVELLDLTVMAAHPSNASSVVTFAE